MHGLGLASLGSGQREEARAAFAELLELAIERSAYVAEALSGIALSADPAAADRAARLRGAVARLSSDADVVANAYFEREHELELVAAPRLTHCAYQPRRRNPSVNT